MIYHQHINFGNLLVQNALFVHIKEQWEDAHSCNSHNYWGWIYVNFSKCQQSHNHNLNIVKQCTLVPQQEQ